MKTILRTIFALTLFTGFVACEDEQDLIYLHPEGEFQILSPVSGEGVILSPDTPLNPGLSLTWEGMEFGSPTEITYTVQVDKSGDEFDTPIDLVATPNTYATVSSDALNSAAGAAGLTPFEQGGLEVRIRATVGTTGSEPSYSGIITYLVTPFSTDLPKLAVPGNHQGWDPPTAPRIAASGFGQTDYEGYIWLDGGFKLVAPDASGNFNWGNTEYGDDGSFSGILTATSGADIVVAAGYYRVNANTGTLVYTTVATTWGIIGAATPGGWDNSTALTYNATNKTWEGDVVLTAGEYKFRANNAWTINLGGDNDDDGYMNYDGPNLSAAAGGSYHVVLDLSDPRQYTSSITAN